MGHHYDANPTPILEAKALLHLVSLGLESLESARELIDVTDEQAALIDPLQVRYRKAILGEFLRLADAQPPPPPPARPTITIKAPNPEVIVSTPGPPTAEVAVPRKASPEAEAIIERTAAHFGITIERLTSRNGRGSSGVPRWACVLALRTVARLKLREVAPLVGYARDQCAFDACTYLRQRRARDPEFDRDIDALLESLRQEHPGTNRFPPPTQSAAQQPHEPRGDEAERPSA